MPSARSLPSPRANDFAWLLVCQAIRCTDPADAEIFCKETGADALAIAIGNAHDNYPVASKDKFCLMMFGPS